MPKKINLWSGNAPCVEESSKLPGEAIYSIVMNAGINTGRENGDKAVHKNYKRLNYEKSRL